MPAENAHKREAVHKISHPFFRSYGARLHSSLTTVNSITLGIYPHLPVSVYGTVTHFAHPPRFSWQHGVSQFIAAVALTPRHLSPLRATGLDAHIQQRAEPSLLRPSENSNAKWVVSEYLTDCPSSTPFGLDLGTD